MAGFTEIEGRRLTIRDRTVKVARAVDEALDAVRRPDVTIREQDGARIDAVWAALARGNPDLTRDWLEENLEDAQWSRVLSDIMAAWGVKTETKPAGEAQSP